MKAAAFKIFLVLMCIGASPHVIAGGDHWQVVVESIANAEDAGKIAILTSQEPGLAFGNCSRAIIHVAYDPRPFWQRIWNKLPVSHADHGRAVEFLVLAASSRKPINFGVIGEGLGQKPGTACEYISHGLEVVEETGKRTAVYSYYKWP